MGLGGVDLTGMGGSVERAIHDPHQFLSQWLPSHLAAHLPYVHCATNFCLNFSPVCYKNNSFSVSGSGPATLQPNSSPTYALCNQFLPKVFSSVLQKHQYLSGSGSGPATMQPNQCPKYLQSQLNKLEKICLSSPQNTAMCFMILFVDLRPCDLEPG